MGLSSAERELVLKYLTRMMYSDSIDIANSWKTKIKSLECYDRKQTSHAEEWTLKTYLENQYFKPEYKKLWLLCHRQQYHNLMDTTNAAESWNK